MKRSIIIGLVVLLTLSVVACVQGASLQDAVTRAISKTSEVQSYRATGNTTYFTNTEEFESSFVAEIAAPDQYRSKTVTDGKWFESIVIGDNCYMRSWDEPQWRGCQSSASYQAKPPPYPSITPHTTPTPIPDLTPTPLPTPALSPVVSTVLVAHMSLEETLRPLSALVDIKVLPDDEIDGVNCSHYHGRIDQDSYVEIVKEEMRRAFEEVAEPQIDYLNYLELLRQIETNVELWIDGDDYIRQIEKAVSFTYTGPDTDDEQFIAGFEASRFYDFDQPIRIQSPDTE